MDDPMKKADYLVGILQGSAKNQFRMEWEGSKIPKGATINGIEIGWTQHGLVTGKGGERLGTYEREVEFGGASGNQQVMIIGTDYQDVAPPPGGKVEPVSRENGKGGL